MNDVVDTIDYKGHKIQVIQDPDPLNPRTDWDNMGIFIYSHRNYRLGDEELDTSQFNSTDEIVQWLKKEKGAVVILPVFAYEHGGITLSTGRGGQFSDRWDSGQVGYIYTTKQKIKEFMGKDYKKITPQVRKQLEEHLIGEIKTLDDYYTGNVHGFRIVREVDGIEEDACDGLDNCMDSVWGFYGDTDYMVSEAKEMVDSIIKQKKEIRSKQREAFRKKYEGYPEEWTQPDKKVPELDYWEE